MVVFKVKENHWDIWQDFCVYCGKFIDYDTCVSYNTNCDCDVFDETHTVRRRIHFKCLDTVHIISEKCNATIHETINAVEQITSPGMTWLPEKKND